MVAGSSIRSLAAQLSTYLIPFIYVLKRGALHCITCSLLYFISVFSYGFGPTGEISFQPFS